MNMRSAVTSFVLASATMGPVVLSANRLRLMRVITRAKTSFSSVWSARRSRAMLKDNAKQPCAAWLDSSPLSCATGR